MALEGALLRPARESALPQPRRRQVRAAPVHAVQLPGRGGALRRSAEPVAPAHRRWTRTHLPLPHPDAGAAIDPDPAAPRGDGELQGAIVPHLRLAARAGRDGGQARRRHRHRRDRRGFHEVTREERLALWDKLYDEPGFGIWLRNFKEIFTDEKANSEFSEYIADRIRRRVKDPKVAEKLIPRDHGFGIQRVPLETGYFEAYNRSNVHLVDISETPIVSVTERGLRTSAGDYDFDIIVYATGFDAITGAFDRIDIQGVGGEKLADKWRTTISTFLGMMIHGFPNMLMPAGPQSGSASTNYPRGIETGVNWCTDLLEYMAAHGYARCEATETAEKRWTDHVTNMYAMMLMRKANSWFTGYNSNVAGHEQGTIRYLVYNGGAPKYVNTINAVAAKGYEGVVLSADRGAAPTGSQPTVVV